MKDLIKTLLTTFPFLYNEDKTGRWSGESAYKYCQENKLDRTKLKDADGVIHRITTSAYFDKKNVQKHCVWINIVSENEIPVSEMAQFTVVE